MSCRQRRGLSRFVRGQGGVPFFRPPPRKLIALSTAQKTACVRRSLRSTPAGRRAARRLLICLVIYNREKEGQRERVMRGWLHFDDFLLSPQQQLPLIFNEMPLHCCGLPGQRRELTLAVLQEWNSLIIIWLGPRRCSTNIITYIFLKTNLVSKNFEDLPLCFKLWHATRNILFC